MPIPQENKKIEVQQEIVSETSGTAVVNITSDNTENRLNQTGTINIVKDGLTVNLNVAKTDEETTHSAQLGYQKEIVLNKQNQISASGSISEENGTFTQNASIGYQGVLNLENSQITLGADFSEANGEFNHNIDVTLSGAEREDGTALVLHNDSSQTYGAVGKIKSLMNRDNLADTKNWYQANKEYLQTHEDTNFNYMSQVGWSKEDKFFTQHTILYEINKDNFLSAGALINSNKHSFFAKADLKNFIADYNFTEEGNKNEYNREQQLSLAYKGEKNQYSMDLATEKTRQENGAEENKFTFGGAATLNRTEYGEFNSGLNGQFSVEGVCINGKVNGIKAKADGAYNYYGCEHEKTTDFLISTVNELEKTPEITNFNTSTYADLRLNNCNTIFEAMGGYEYKKPTGLDSIKSVWANVGIYQQFGKNFDDVTGYMKAGFVKTLKGIGENYKQAVIGVKTKATERLTLGAEAGYRTDMGFSGNIRMAVNF